MPMNLRHATALADSLALEPDGAISAGTFNAMLRAAEQERKALNADRTGDFDEKAAN